MEKIPLPHLLLTHGWYKFQLPVSFLRRPRYRSNQRWKHNTVASIAMAVKVAIVISQSIVVIYHKPGHKLLYTPMTYEMKCPIGYTSALCIPFYLLRYRYNTCTNTINKWYDPLHNITWPYWFIDLDLTCSSPLPSSIGAKSCSNFTSTRSIASKPPTCPSRLQPVHQSKPHLDPLHLVTWLHVMSHMQWAH